MMSSSAPSLAAAWRAPFTCSIWKSLLSFVTESRSRGLVIHGPSRVQHNDSPSSASWRVSSVTAAFLDMTDTGCHDLEASEFQPLSERTSAGGNHKFAARSDSTLHSQLEALDFSLLSHIVSRDCTAWIMY